MFLLTDSSIYFLINSIQDRGRDKKAPLPLFFPVTNVGINPQIFLTFSFNPIATLVWNVKAIPSASIIELKFDSQIIELKTKTAPQKNWFFKSNSVKIEVMITSFIKMLELPNFGYMTSSTI